MVQIMAHKEDNMIIKLEKTLGRFEWIQVTAVNLDTFRGILYFRCASNDSLEMVDKNDDVIKHVYLDHDILIFTTNIGSEDVELIWADGR